MKENKFKIGDHVYTPRLWKQNIEEEKITRYYIIKKVTETTYIYDIFLESGKLVEENFKYAKNDVEEDSVHYKIKNTKLARKIYPNYRVDGDWLIRSKND